VSAQAGNVPNPTVPLPDSTTIEWSSLPGAQTNLSVYNASSNERTGVSAPLPAPGVNNSTNNALLDNYAAASVVSFEQVPASIGNYVWVDANADGIRQPAEQGIPGVLVFLDLNHDGQYETGEPSCVTDAQGYYLITNLLGGTYTVCVATNTLPAGASETYSLIGGTSAPQESVTVPLTNGTTRLDCNFGYRYESPTLAVLQAGSFQGVAAEGGVLLTWNTLSEVDSEFYFINRLTADGEYDDQVAGAVSLNSPIGGLYSVEDPTATAPGTYQYQLVEQDIYGIVTTLGYCTVMVGSPAGSADSPIVVTISLEGGSILLQWTGGTPPYVVEKTTSLVPSTSAKPNFVGGQSTGWQPVSTNTANTVLLPMEDPAAFFRVSGGQ
jgi:hypothetical protein